MSKVTKISELVDIARKWFEEVCQPHQEGVEECMCFVPMYLAERGMPQCLSGDAEAVVFVVNLRENPYVERNYPSVGLVGLEVLHIAEDLGLQVAAFGKEAKTVFVGDLIEDYAIVELM